jgi:hypothetical protein
MKKATFSRGFSLKLGSLTWARTRDLRINSQQILQNTINITVYFELEYSTKINTLRNSTRIYMLIFKRR